MEWKIQYFFPLLNHMHEPEVIKLNMERAKAFFKRENDVVVFFFLEIRKVIKVKYLILAIPNYPFIEQNTLIEPYEGS